MGKDGFYTKGMKLTTKSHYSVKALLDLALQPDYGPASVKAIAERQNIPGPYLEKLLITLRRAGIVNAYRGMRGGYQLAQAPDQISLGQILAALEESLEPFPQYRNDQTLAEDWVTLSVWRQLHQKFIKALYSITLADLYYDARSWQAAQGEGINFIV
ncbi:RrF2 family transcriptional regulator [Synechocystis sp. PCC 7338]|uniref:Rrf2 family transcriptional regulator n=1 Tax=Synechocystis sp. PCC 7338 TaxID=2732530 RepID=UPI001BAE6E3E|nr:RrF2 family transcriptional regulator [Synechocystis sp. PCC 7338]QUS59794.1 RrF2 family transcriptional regulator [Synechocystis sp. PCC 7338]